MSRDFEIAKKRNMEIFVQIADFYEQYEPLETSIEELYDVSKEFLSEMDNAIREYLTSRREKSISAIHAYRFIKDRLVKKFGKISDNERACIAEASYTLVVKTIAVNEGYWKGYAAGFADGLNASILKACYESPDSESEDRGVCS